MPESGAKLELYSYRVRSELLQSVSDACSAVPIMNSVLLRATIPVIMMKMMSMKTKMTPIEPTFMKMPKSFLLQITVRATQRTMEQ